VKFDKNGKFLKAWGTKGSGRGQFNTPHGIDIDRNGLVYVADRGNRRIQIFDREGQYKDEWPDLRSPNHIIITPDQYVWVGDGSTEKFLKYDMKGKLQYSWGSHGTYPGAFWEMHQFSVDSDGNLYAAESYGGRTQKFRPKAGATRSKLITPLVSLMSTSSR
jgi:sugar lactone lactonase YvrE